MYEPRDFTSPQAFDFIADKLESLSPWGQAALRGLRLRQGKARCLLPRGVPHEFVETHGFELNPPGLRLDIARESSLQAMEAEAPFGEDYLLIAQDPAEPEAGDGIDRAGTAVLGSTLFYWEQTHREDIAQAAGRVLRRAEAWTVALALVVDAPRVTAMARTGRLSHDGLSEMIEKTEMILLDAFDGVGYILWQRDRD